jgi:hypothetical protein
LAHLNTDSVHPSVKLVENCESRLFQRPDDAVHRGFDTQTEEDLAGGDNFITNFEPLSRRDAQDLMEDAIGFHKYTRPMQELIRTAAQSPEGAYFVSSAHARVVNGRPSPNVRYLQMRPDLADPRDRYIAEMGARLYRRVPLDKPLHFPADALLPGRRNNPADPMGRVPPLAVYNPIHYQELPELFMDFICSLTGKSPSTTGAGSEGALTKGPFNPLCATADLNNALVSFILCGYDGFTTAAGHIGVQRRVDHDISLLIPEIWCRLPMRDRDPRMLIERGYLEKLEDLEFLGKRVPASRLGYRITSRFIHAYFGKVFDNPTAVFDEAMLKPETQDMAAFVAGVENIVAAQRRVARNYLEDASVEDACPPLQALLHIMAGGTFEGKDANHPDVRALFTRDYLLASDWYQERLELKQQRDSALWQRHVAYIRNAVACGSCDGTTLGDELRRRLQEAEEQLAYVSSPAYGASLRGTLGADWIHRAAC